MLIAFGAMAILFPAWLPNKPSAPLSSGSVELLQAMLLAAAAAVMFGAQSHTGAYRPVARIIGLGLIAALIGEMEDFLSGFLGVRFPEGPIIAFVLLVALVTAIRNKRVVIHFFSTIGRHAGSGFIAAALLIIYVFNRIMGRPKFWQATLGDAYSPEVPVICSGYLELLACYLIFVGSLGFAISMARRIDP
ncbi:MAG: hypothetical protein ACNA8L_03925 [Luteolibacter sp.]